MTQKSYRHLDSQQRYTIQQMIAKGHSQTSIAGIIGVSPSTVSRELARNQDPCQRYDAHAAQTLAAQRRHEANQHRRLPQETVDLALDKLGQQWSPEQIAGRLAKDQGVSICHQTIYRYIHQDRAQGGTLYRHLRHRGRPYKRPVHGQMAGRGRIPNRVDISKRPSIVDRNTQPGHLEGDLIMGAHHQGALLTVVERCSKRVWLKWVPSKHTHIVTSALIALLRGIPAALRKTITFDNGKEFASHQRMTKALGTKVYFARPYRSCDRGLNEHTNGLIRQYLPKKQSLANLPWQMVKRIETLLNNRPRKVLNYNTPSETWNAAVRKSACAL